MVPITPEPMLRERVVGDTNPGVKMVPVGRATMPCSRHLSFCIHQGTVWKTSFHAKCVIPHNIEIILLLSEF